MGGYILDPTMPVLLRPDGAVQVGWDPRRAVLVRPPQGLTAGALAAMLRHLQTGQAPDEPGARAALDNLLPALIDARLVTRIPARPARTPTIRIHGRGPLSDLLLGALRCSSSRITHSGRPDAGAPREPTDLVVLADYLVCDPRLIRELHATGIPHLPVRVRDGTGLVGPLVIPGVTSCLGCADLHRSDRDAAWPAVAAQLRDTVGGADRATVLGTAALALNQIDQVLRAVRGDAGHDADPPATLNTTLEFDVGAGTVLARHWSRHPHCGC